MRRTKHDNPDREFTSFFGTLQNPETTVPIHSTSTKIESPASTVPIRQDQTPDPPSRNQTQDLAVPDGLSGSPACPEPRREVALATERNLRRKRSPASNRTRHTRRELARKVEPQGPTTAHESGRHADLSHHQRRCSVCRHPDRLAIEEDFIHWRSPSEICIEYEISDRASIYRHAHATGLFSLRRRNLRWVLEYILEQAEEVEVTGSAVVRAVRAYTRITDNGEWVEPPMRIFVSRSEFSESALPAPREDR